MIASSVCVCTITPGDCLCTLEGLNGGDDNARGYSKSQNKLFNALVMIHNKPTNDNNNIRNNNDNNINGPFDSWGNPSSAPYPNGNTTASLTMAAFSGDGSSPEPTEVFPEKIEHDVTVRRPVPVPLPVL